MVAFRYETGHSQPVPAEFHENHGDLISLTFLFKDSRLKKEKEDFFELSNKKFIRKDSAQWSQLVNNIF
jgi:hypothetical protein